MREINPFAVRMPPELRERVEQPAKQARRSLNSELVIRIEQSFELDAAPYRVAEQMPDYGLPADEQRLLNAYRQASPKKREAILALLGD